jgi:hypothetical protein|tara:strand:+ start:48 stop:353 length:306 start_codon:yes stop_codon:yes gene_type:complete
MAEFNPGWEPTLDGLEGNMMAQPRVFGHDAVALTAGTGAIANTGKRGAVIYNGGSAQSITITTEAGNDVVFKNVQPGTVVGDKTPMLATKLKVGTDCVAIF